MSNTTRDIKRRIRSVANTKKITKAMELVAAAKMRKTVKATLETRTYAELAWSLAENLSQRTNREIHPLLRKRDEVKNVGIILITSNRGLVGAFNAQLINKCLEHVKNIQKNKKDINVEFILNGRKGQAIYTKYNYRVAADYPKTDVVTRVEEVRAMAKQAMDDYTSLKYDQIFISYTDFISTLNQQPKVRLLLPIERRITGLGETKREKLEETLIDDIEYLFEPSADIVLEMMLKRLVEMQIFQAVLESNASEHSARMMTMRNATNAASDLIDDLTLSYNKARQASITKDLTEISSSRLVIET